MSNMRSAKFGPTELSKIQDIFYCEESALSLSTSISMLGNKKNSSNPNCARIRKVLILRNHSFEFIAQNISKLVQPFNFEVDFTYTDYGEFFDIESLNYQQYDALIFWIDFNLISSSALDEYFSYLVGILSAVRNNFFRPIYIGEPVTNSKNSQSYFRESLDDLNCNLIHVGIDGCFNSDFKTIPFLGSFLDLDAQVRCSLAMSKVLARDLQSPVKLIAVDLDNTMYNGVLAEDGPRNLIIEPNHKRLHATLRKFHEKGILITFLSKNVMEDFLELMSQNAELKAILELGQKNKVNWDPKFTNLLAVCEAFNIHHDSVLFIDDNPGEIAEMMHNLPEVRCILAPATESTICTDDILQKFPLNMENSDLTDKLRAHDLKANDIRASIISAGGSSLSYIKDAHVTLSFFVNTTEQFSRYSQLSKKTNQFNSALKRVEEAEIMQATKYEGFVAIGISMKDRFSDSGNIGFVFAHALDDKIIIEDLALSCRALGRSIENVLFEEVFKFLREYFNLNFVHIVSTKGPRNQPTFSYFSTNYYCDMSNTVISIRRVKDEKVSVTRELIDIEWSEETDGYQ